jgi:large subunit ribosomal protein L16
VIYELEGVPEDVAREAFRLCGHKLPFGTKFLTRREVL